MRLEEAIQWIGCAGVGPTQGCQFSAADFWILAGILAGILCVAYAGLKVLRALLTWRSGVSSDPANAFHRLGEFDPRELF